MSTSIGQRTIGRTGRLVRANADGMPGYKEAGVTIDWTTVPAAAGTETVLSPSDQVIPANVKHMRYGTILCRITSGGSAGKYGPYASGATDGRQTLTQGLCFVLDETVLETDEGSEIQGGVIDSGLVFADRVTDIAANPAIAALRTAFPRIYWVDNP